MAKHAILQTFYASSRWRNFRLGLILERSKETGAICEKCGKLMARPIDIHAHHKKEITPENVSDYNISLNPNNIELICHSCHDEEHYRFGHKPARKVYIVYGSPLSGKKTFVREVIKRGDIVVDMDRLYEAVSMLPSFDKPDNLFSNVMAIHNLLIDNIKTRMGKWNNAYVIGGYADRFKRNKIANDLGAELVHCEATKEECYARLAVDSDRQYRVAEWQGYIDKWFDNYSE